MPSPPNPARATANSASDAGSGTGTSGGSDWTWTVRLLGKAKPEAAKPRTIKIGTTVTVLQPQVTEQKAA